MSLDQFFPKHYIARDPNVDKAVFSLTAESQYPIIIEANHQPMTLVGDQTQTQVKDVDFIEDFLTGERGDGNGFRSLFLLGEPGTGKSHLIAWLREHLKSSADQRDTNYWVLNVARNEGVVSILKKLSTLVTEKGHADWVSDIESADMWTSEQIWDATFELIGGPMRLFLQEDYPKYGGHIDTIFEDEELDRDGREEIYKMMNALLTNEQFVTKFLLGKRESVEQKPLFNLFRDNINPERIGAETIQRSFVYTDFVWDLAKEKGSFSKSHELNLHFQRFIEEVATKKENSRYIKLLNSVLSGVLDKVIKKERNLQNFSLESKITELREKIHTLQQETGSRNEFIILFEDLVAGAAGTNLPEQINELIMASIVDDTVAGVITRCTIRSIIGCTKGFYESLPPETLKSRTQEGSVTEKWFIATKSAFTEDDAVALVSRYLHAARLGVDTLQNLRTTQPDTWRDFDQNTLPQNNKELEQLKSFGFSTLEYPLFPLNSFAIKSMYTNAVKPDGSVSIRKLLDQVKDFLALYEQWMKQPNSLLKSPELSQLFPNAADVNTQLLSYGYESVSEECEQFLNIYGLYDQPQALWDWYGLQKLDGLPLLPVSGSGFPGIEPIINPPPPPPKKLNPISVALNKWYKGSDDPFVEKTVATPLRETAIRVLSYFGLQGTDSHNMGRGSIRMENMSIPGNGYIILQPTRTDKNKRHTLQLLQIMAALNENFNINVLNRTQQTMLIEWVETQRPLIEAKRKESVGFNAISNKPGEYGININGVKNEHLQYDVQWLRWTVPMQLELQNLHHPLETIEQCMQALQTPVPLSVKILPTTDTFMPSKRLVDINGTINRSQRIVKLHKDHCFLHEKIVKASRVLPYIQKWLEEKSTSNHSPTQAPSNPKGNSALTTIMHHYNDIMVYLRSVPDALEEELKEIQAEMEQWWGFSDRAPTLEELTKIAKIVHPMAHTAGLPKLTSTLAFLGESTITLAKFNKSQGPTQWTPGESFTFPDTPHQQLTFRTSATFKRLEHARDFGQTLFDWLNQSTDILNNRNSNVSSTAVDFQQQMTTIENQLSTTHATLCAQSNNGVTK